MKYKQAKCGEWLKPVMKNYMVACCDCHLVHTIDFKVVNGQVWFRAKRNGRATANKRRTLHPYIMWKNDSYVAPNAVNEALRNITGRQGPSSRMMPTSGRKIISASPATMNGI